MLKVLRKHTKTVVWIIVLAFVLWGGSSLLVSQSRSTSYAGEIFHQKVSYKEYTDISKMLGIFSTPVTLPKNSQDTEIWLYLILKREAIKQKISASDEEVRDQIKVMFGGEERFSALGYERWVQNVLRENPRNFEELVREFIRIQKLVKGINRQPIQISDQEIQARSNTEKKGRLDETKREEYRKKISEEKAKARFTEWTRTLIQEANIKKY